MTAANHSCKKWLYTHSHSCT